MAQDLSGYVGSFLCASMVTRWARSHTMAGWRGCTILPSQLSVKIMITIAMGADSREHKVRRNEISSDPVSESERIFGVDVLRGAAVLGILVINVQFFSMVSSAVGNPAATGNLLSLNFLVWLFGHVFAEQKFMTIFSILFGAGIILMTRRIEAAGKSSAGRHYRRMSWLILFGLLHAYLIWSGDILVAYGLCGMLAYQFRRFAERTLLVLAFFFIAVGSACLAGWGFLYLSLHGQEMVRISAWIPGSVSAAAETAAYQGSWLAQMRVRSKISVQTETFTFIIFTFWRVTGLMLAGMAMLKSGWLHPTKSPIVYWKMIGIAAFVGVPITLCGTYRDFVSDSGHFYSGFLGAQFNYWASLLISSGWIALVMLAVDSERSRPFARRLAAVGRMAFTNYLMQSLICTTIFYGHGIGLFGKVDRVAQLVAVIGIWILQFAVSSIWIKHFFFGPMEWLWRSLTYQRWEPFRRSATSSGF